MISRVLKYLKLCQAFGILVVPVWESAHYWPILQDILVDDSAYVRGILYLTEIYKQYRKKKFHFWF